MGLADFTETLKEISDFLKGIHSFLSGISLISETIGFSTILLGVAVVIFSAGYSAIGIPRGKVSFFTSLITADSIWLFWNISFIVPLPEYIMPMVKSNVLILAPFIAVTILMRISPWLLASLKRWRPLIFKKKAIIDSKIFLALHDEYLAHSARLNRSLIHDAADVGNDGGIILSAETKTCISTMRTLLTKIYNAGDPRK